MISNSRAPRDAYPCWHTSLVPWAAVYLTRPASGRPSLRKTVIAGHQFVNADCNKFSPTNAFSHSQFGDTPRPRTNEVSTTTPAINLGTPGRYSGTWDLFVCD
jgi:hypothetical protein